MSGTVVLAWWQFAVLAVLAALAITNLLIKPLFQRIIYRKSLATQRELIDRLDFGLPTYAIANRHVWLDRLINDDGVVAAVEEAVERTGEEADAVLKRARSYAEELVPSFNVWLYFRFGYWIARLFIRVYYWIAVGRSEDAEYDRLPDDCLVVMVSNHRSNFDPQLLIYLTARRSPLSYSAGAWALGFPFRQILRQMGFYVLRQDAMGDPLYRKVLERFVFLAGSHGVPQGVFLEGALSRDGRMQPLKLGLLSYMLRAHGHGKCKDIVFIPAALNYDKIPEDRTLVAARDEGFTHRGRWWSLVRFVRFFFTVVTYAMPRRHKPFGYACVNFGMPLSLADWQQTRGVDLSRLDGQERIDSVTALGRDLAENIRSLIPVLPTNVLAQVLSQSSDLPISEMELKARALRLLQDLDARDAPVLLPRNDEDYAFGQAIYVLLRRKVLRPTGDGRYALVDGSGQLLDYYRNTIAHYLERPAAADDAAQAT